MESFHTLPPFATPSAQYARSSDLGPDRVVRPARQVLAGFPVKVTYSEEWSLDYKSSLHRILSSKSLVLEHPPFYKGHPRLVSRTLTIASTPCPFVGEGHPLYTSTGRLLRDGTKEVVI